MLGHFGWSNASEDHVSAFANLPISRKLMAAFAAVVVVIFASSAIIYDRLLLIEWAKNRRIHTTNVLETLQNAMDAMVDQETGVRGYLITGDEKFLEPYHRGGNAYTAAIQKIKELTSDNPAQQSRLDELNELAKKWRSGIAEREIALMAKPETREDARALEGSTAGKTAMDLIRAKVDEIDGVERDLLAKRDAVQNQAFATAYKVTILGGVASLIIATLMGVLLARGIAVPITRMTSAMTTLAKGDTTVAVPGVSRSDEIGAMAAAVQIFRDNMIERERAQAELAHVNRVTTLGQLTASIAHEVNQPVAAVVTNADAALRWLGTQPPDLEEARQALDSIIKDGNRAAHIIHRIRTFIKKVPTRKDRLDINETILEVIALTHSEVLRNGVSLQTRLAKDLPPIQGDRVQLQQVMLNLIINAVEAMSEVNERSRELLIGSGKDASNGVLVAVRDSGPGLNPESFDHLFDAFYTTKPGGMGMGLSICRSIIEAHEGQMWAAANAPQGAIFQFTLPTQRG
jgi:C4-dicarboxylate-specific signal transduction histidine kinase